MQQLLCYAAFIEQRDLRDKMIVCIMFVNALIHGNDAEDKNRLL